MGVPRGYMRAPGNPEVPGSGNPRAPGPSGACRPGTSGVTWTSGSPGVPGSGSPEVPRRSGAPGLPAGTVPTGHLQAWVPPGYLAQVAPRYPGRSGAPGLPAGKVPTGHLQVEVTPRHSREIRSCFFSKSKKAPVLIINQHKHYFATVGWAPIRLLGSFMDLGAHRAGQPEVHYAQIIMLIVRT